MDSLDAQCLLAHLIATDRSAGLPERWRHLSDGTLSFRFAGSPNDYTYRPPEVAEMAARWRKTGAAIPHAVRDAVDAHRSFAALCERTGRPGPEMVLHDLDAGEVTALWPEQKLAVVIDGLDDPALSLEALV